MQRRRTPPAGAADRSPPLGARARRPTISKEDACRSSARSRSALSPLSATARRQDHPSRSPAERAGRSRPPARSSAAPRCATSIRSKRSTALPPLRHRPSRPRRLPHLPDRHAGLSGLHRPGDRRARRGRDRRGGDQRAERDRDDRQPDDGVGGEAQPLPRPDRQQDRRRERQPAAGAREPTGGVRQGVPADQPAGGRREEGRRLLLQPRRRVGLLLGRGRAPRARRPGGRDGRGPDGGLPGARARSRPTSCTRRSSRRCAKAISCRSASSPRATAPASRSCSTCS